MRSSIRSPERFSALFFALVLLLGNLHAALHTRQIRHVVCPEHGELLHAPAHAHAADEAHSASDATDTPVVRAADEASDHHDVCTVLHALRDGQQAWLDGASTLDARNFEWVAHVAQPVLEPRAETIARYRLAPKQSPPLG